MTFDDFLKLLLGGMAAVTLALLLHVFRRVQDDIKQIREDAKLVTNDVNVLKGIMQVLTRRSDYKEWERRSNDIEFRKE